MIFPVIVTKIGDAFERAFARAEPLEQWLGSLHPAQAI